MVVQSFLYLLVCLNRTELFPRGHREFLKTSTPPSREITASPVNGLKEVEYSVVSTKVMACIFPLHIIPVSLDRVFDIYRDIWKIKEGPGQ